MRFWAYRHTDGQIHLKHYHDDFGEDAMEDAENSDFVDIIYGPFNAESRQKASEKAKQMLDHNSG